MLAFGKLRKVFYLISLIKPMFPLFRARPAAGFVEEDNSGKSNIFGVEPKTLYTSSPRSQEAASQGIGGAQGRSQLGYSPLSFPEKTTVIFDLCPPICSN